MLETKYSFLGGHAYWCPGSLSRQGISRRGIDSMGLATCRVAPCWIGSSVEQNPIYDTKCEYIFLTFKTIHHVYPDSKVHGANIGPTRVLSAPDRTHVGPTNLAIKKELRWVSGYPVLQQSTGLWHDVKPWLLLSRNWKFQLYLGNSVLNKGCDGNQNHAIDRLNIRGAAIIKPIEIRAKKYSMVLFDNIVGAITVN